MDTSLLLLCSLVTLICGAPQYGDHEEYQHAGGGHEVHEQIHEQVHEQPHKPIHIPILQQKSELQKDGYQFSYKTGNGIHAEESGYLKKVPADPKDPEHADEAIVMHGKVSYTGTDGVPITLTYVADENGFQAQGAHLPTPPPLPLELQKALEIHAQQHQAQHQQVEHKEQEYQEDYGQQYTYQ